MDLFTTTNQFNLSLFKQYETSRWKFLDDMSPEESKGVGYLLSSPKPVVYMTIGYIIFVKIFGPWLMSFIDAFQLKTLIRFYNLLMVLLAGALLKELYNAIGTLGSLFECDKIFNFQDGSANYVYQMSNFIIIVRLSEYLDTIFFTLRKKQNQVTFLHVFHHAFVPIYAYWILRTAPCRYNVFIIIINSFIHVIMYFYYFIATFQERPVALSSNDNNRNSKKQIERSFIQIIIYQALRFKKYVTQLQILQFVALAVYAISVIFRPNRCGAPLTYIWANILLAFTFLSLFLHFYLKSYKQAAAAAAKKNKKD